MDQHSNAALFASLHRQEQPLRLPNAWDAGSARLIESLGAAAIATTSAGVAWSLGYRDGDVLPPAPHAASVAAIARAIHVPLSVDIEGGYARDADRVGEVVARFIDAGAVGINIQDALGVRRVSAGSWIPQTLWAQASTLVTGFLADGRSEPLVAGAAPYAEVNAGFADAGMP